MKKIMLFSLLLMAMAFVACGGNQGKPVDDNEPKPESTEDSMKGKWITVKDDNSGELSDTMGVELLSGGVAKSINMPSYQYRKWKVKGDTVVISVVSSVDGVVDSTLADSGIVDLGKGTITLFDGDIVYRKQQ